LKSTSIGQQWREFDRSSCQISSKILKMEIKELINLFLKILPIDFFRYFITASLAFVLFWKLFRRQLNHKFIQSKWPTNRKLLYEFKYSMSTVVIFATIGVGIVTSINNGWTMMYGEIGEYGWVYFFFSISVMILFHDLYFYWTHRWMHHPRIFKHVHLVHHKSTNPSPWAAYSFHPIEAVVQALVFPILLFILPIHSVAALTFLIYMIVRNVWGHLGFELFPKGFTRNKWIGWHTTTTHHNLHHEKFSYNFGLYFTWWDRWFKTEHPDYEKSFERIASRKKESKGGKVLTAIILVLLSSAVMAQSPKGKWMTYDEVTGTPLSIVEIKYDNKFNCWFGQVDSVLLQAHQGTDPICSNCKGKQSGAKVIGIEFLNGFKKDGEEWTGGKILDPANGEVYDSGIWLDSEGTLKVRGFGGPLGLFYRTQTWKKKDNSSCIEGLWNTIDDTYNLVKSVVELSVVNGELKGYIREIYLLPHEGNYPLCTQCNGSLKNKPIVGLRFMDGFFKSDDQWINGTILDPGNGQTYSSRFWLEGNNKLIVRGYLGPFYRTQTWRRFEPEVADKRDVRTAN